MTIYVVTEHDSRAFTNIDDAINYCESLDRNVYKRIEIIDNEGFVFDYLNSYTIDSIAIPKQVM